MSCPQPILHCQYSRGSYLGDLQQAKQISPVEISGNLQNWMNFTCRSLLFALSWLQSKCHVLHMNRYKGHGWRDYSFPLWVLECQLFLQAKMALLHSALIVIRSYLWQRWAAAWWCLPFGRANGFFNGIQWALRCCPWISDIEVLQKTAYICGFKCVLVVQVWWQNYSFEYHSAHHRHLSFYCYVFAAIFCLAFLHLFVTCMCDFCAVPMLFWATALLILCNVHVLNWTKCAGQQSDHS